MNLKKERIYKNSTAPILPGYSAAEILIGSPIKTVLKDQETYFLVEEVKILLLLG